MLMRWDSLVGLGYQPPGDDQATIEAADLALMP